MRAMASRLITTTRFFGQGGHKRQPCLPCPVKVRLASFHAAVFVLPFGEQILIVLAHMRSIPPPAHASSVTFPSSKDTWEGIRCGIIGRKPVHPAMALGRENSTWRNLSKNLRGRELLC